MNITRDKRILRFIKNKYDNPSIQKYIEFLLPRVSAGGEILNYFSIHNQLKDILFNGSSAELTDIYIRLLNDGIMKLAGTTLILNCYSSSFLSLAEDELRFNSTRQYRKQLEGQQELAVVFDKWDKAIQKVDIDPKQISAAMSELLLGVKCPRYFLPYLAGKLLSQEELQSLSPSELSAEEARRNLSKECIMLLVSYFAICNHDGVIPYFNIHSVSQYLIEKVFEGNTKCLSTLYLCHNQLLELGFVQVVPDGLLISHYAEAFGKSKNYVIIPHVVFKRHFKRLHIGSMRLFFEWIFMLNNGEDGNRNHGAGKKIYYRAYTTDWNTPGEKKKYKSVLAWLR